ncbi:MAG: hypothetical protein MHM6MM_002369 [Cercozoa sp. M6MM]
MVHSENFDTQCIHAGQEPDPQTGAVCTPISLATTYAQSSPGVFKGFEYSRTLNPTRKVLEACVAELEKGKYGFAFSSGSAVTATIVNMLATGDHIVSVDDVYGGTHRYLKRVVESAHGIDVSFVGDLTDKDAMAAVCTDKTKLIWIETPTNPTLKVTDVEAAVIVARQVAPQALVVIDNTFATPYNQNPLEMGVDIVVHSATKYINGHSDVVMGLAVTRSEEIAQRLHFLQNSIGAVPAPFDCYMALRGIKTLALRMERHADNAAKVAAFLETRTDVVKKVYYPFLESHPNHAVAKKQMRTGGGMVTLFLHGLEESKKFLEELKVFTLAESLGAVESLAEHPVIMTHAAVPPEHRAALGIDDGLVRLSVGVENIDDILADLTNALDQVAAMSK